jgi:hypothetical protein
MDDCSAADETDPGFPRSLGRGRAFVYVLACRNDSVFKVGFSRDPLDRWRTLHRRFFEFFDLERGVLVATDRVVEARRLERHLLRTFAGYEAFAPLVVAPSAAGHTEWLRGVLDEVVHFAEEDAKRHGFTSYRPVSDWLRPLLLERIDRLYGWTSRMLEAISYATHNPSTSSGAATVEACERQLRDVLDAYRALGIDVAAFVPENVRQWHALASTHRTWA